MKNFLFVGGAGYIGGVTVDMLTNFQAVNVQNIGKIIVFDNLTYEHRYFKAVNFIYGDCRDTQLLLNIIKNEEITDIIWLSAIVGDGACAINPELTRDINTTSVKNIVNAIKENKLDVHFTFLSTCSVYGNQKEYFLNEESSTAPISEYAKSKLEAEQYVNEINGTVFRLGTIYGVGDQFSRIRLDLVVNALTVNAVLNKKIVINGGEQWRPIISVNDVKIAILEAILYDYRGLYIIASENIELKHIGQRVAKAIEGTEIEYTDLPFEDLRNYHVDTDKAKSKFRSVKEFPTNTIENEVERLADLIKTYRIKDVKDVIYHNAKYLGVKVNATN